MTTEAAATLPKGTAVRILDGKHQHPRRIGQIGTILAPEALYGGAGYAVTFPDGRFIVVLARYVEAT